MILGDWAKILNHSLLDTSYMDRLVEFLEYNYSNNTIYPAQADVFRAFRVTQFKDVKVVIIGQDPYFNGKCTGIAFANDDNKALYQQSFSPSLQKIEECIETTVYKGFNIDFDPTLMDWADQGVLLLNSALTVQKNFPGSHTVYWNRFMIEFIKALNQFKTGVHYLFLGAQSSHLAQYVDTKKNYAFKYVHPAWAARNNTEWNCPYFNKINDLIESQNGKEYRIKW